MQRMSGVDAAFVYDERPDDTQHTLKVAIFGPAASSAYSLERTLHFVRARLPELPPLRWRAVRVPLDLHHPVWVEDPDLDLSRHVHRLAIPAPAGRGELCEVISEIASRPLDPTHPLWELWMLEGYAGDRVVAVLKLSHALADGSATRRLVETLYAAEPAAEPPDLAGEPLPSGARLVSDALRDRILDVRHLPGLVRAARDAGRRAPAPRVYTGRRASLLSGAAVPFCGRMSRRRAFQFASFALADARHIQRAFGASLTEVVLATTAGAVRRYLAHRGALSDFPLFAALPASIRTEEEAGDWGNRLTFRTVSLPTHLADPASRLRACQQMVAEVKADLERRRGANLEDWLRVLPPAAAKLPGRATRALVRLRPRLSACLSVTSVRGPERPLQAPGGPIETFISVGHMKYAAGLNATAWSYVDRLNLGLYGCAEAFPDLSRLAEFAGEAFEELAKTAARETARVG